MSPQGLNSSLKSLQLWLLNSPITYVVGCTALWYFRGRCFGEPPNPADPPASSPHILITRLLFLPFLQRFCCHFISIILFYCTSSGHHAPHMGWGNDPGLKQQKCVQCAHFHLPLTEIMCKALSFRFTENLSPCFQNKVAFHLGRTLAWKAFLIPKI